jgi:glucose/arabinose dehydrogenase
MRRTGSVLVLTTLLVALFASAAPPASARLEKRAVVRCRGCWPVALAFTPDSQRMFYVERFSGEIRRYDFGQDRHRLWGRITNLAGKPVANQEQGLLGIALDPRWPDVTRLYVYYTNKDPFETRIVKLRWDDDGTPFKTVLLRIRAASTHNGGVVHFGPDGRLYAVTGDLQNPSNSQDTGSNLGKVLRLTRDGDVPADNPFAGEYAFSYGHRNSFGFTFDPQTDRLWQTENGPECDDEVNLIRSGRNYGWGPSSACPNTSESGPDPVQPEWTWTPVTAPTGATFCNGCELGARYPGRLLVGSFVDGKIRRLRLNADRNNVLRERVVFNQLDGVVAVETRPDGRIFFSDANGIYRLVRV